jgi:excisionase family DNA binding protein
VELLRVSRNTVYRILERGEIPHVHTGRKSIRVRREAFEAWRREQEEASKKKAPSPRKVEAFDPSKGSNHAIVQA